MLTRNGGKEPFKIFPKLDLILQPDRQAQHQVKRRGRYKQYMCVPMH